LCFAREKFANTEEWGHLAANFPCTYTNYNGVRLSLAMAYELKLDSAETERLKSLCTCKLAGGRVHEQDCPMMRAFFWLTLENLPADEREKVMEGFRKRFIDLGPENMQMPGGLNIEQQQLLIASRKEKQLRLLEGYRKLGLTEADLKL
jgi:hypothetical protein